MKSFSRSLRLSLAYLLIFILSYLISGCGGKGSNPVTPNVNEKGSVKVDVKIKTLEPEKFSLADVDRVVISVYSGENQLGTTTVYPGGSSQVYFRIDNIPVGSGYHLEIQVCSSTTLIASKTITGISVYKNQTTSISQDDATVHISPPSSIAISPAEVTLYVGESQQFTATATYSDATTEDVTSSATWSSSNTSVAYLYGATGEFYASSIGTADITATYQEVTSNIAVVTVEPPPPPTSIAITPTEVTLSVGENQQFTAIATYSNGDTGNITLSATWYSSNTSVAYFTIGNLYASSAGTTNITATYQEVTSNTAVVTVEPPPTSSITISPTSAYLDIGATQQFTALAYTIWADEYDITTLAEWSSSNPTVASFGATPGLLTASAKGETTVTATYKGVVSNTASVTVGANTVSGIINTNTTWTLTDSPYLITGDVQIPAGITLTIEPGVTLVYTGAYEILIKGNIIANGTATQKITFTSSKANESSGATQIRFADASLDLSSISYAKFEWAYTGIKIDGTLTGTLTISNSTFSNNSGFEYGGPIYNHGSTLTISNSTFSNNSDSRFGGAIHNYDGTLTISNSTFSNNSAREYGGAIYNGGSGILTIFDSTFSNNSTTEGGAIFNDSTLTISNSTFSNNSASRFGSAIYNNVGTLTISNSKFSSNVGAAITNVRGTISSITYTILTENKIGVEFQAGTLTTFNNNNIYNNTEYDFKNLSTANVAVANNYWGTTDENVIKQKIFDYYDDINYGVVTYSPFLTSPVADAGPQGSARFYTMRNNVAYRFIWCVVPDKMGRYFSTQLYPVRNYVIPSSKVDISDGV